MVGKRLNKRTFTVFVLLILLILALFNKKGITEKNKSITKNIIFTKNNQSSKDHEKKSFYGAKIDNWIYSLSGKSIKNLNDTWWIDGTDTGIKVQSNINVRDGIYIKKTEIDSNGKLHITCSDNQKINLGLLDESVRQEIEKDEIYSEETNNQEEKKQKIPMLYVKPKKIKSGQNNVNFSVCIKNNPGILGMILTLEYDENAMTLKDAFCGEAIKKDLVLTKSKALHSGCRFIWDGKEIEKKEIKDGEILNLIFDIADKKGGKYKFDFSYREGDIINNELMPINLQMPDKDITIFE